MTKNFGKYFQNIFVSGILTKKEIVNVLRALLKQIGNGSIVVTGWDASTNLQSLSPGTIMHNASVVMDLMVVSKPSTKKKSKRGTARVRGMNSSSRAVKSVRGVRSRSK